MLLLKIKAKMHTTFVNCIVRFLHFLTFYSAYYNKVTDCGCFGDAILNYTLAKLAERYGVAFGLIIFGFK